MLHPLSFWIWTLKNKKQRLTGICTTVFIVAHYHSQKMGWDPSVRQEMNK